MNSSTLFAVFCTCDSTISTIRAYCDTEVLGSRLLLFRWSGEGLWQNLRVSPELKVARAAARAKHQKHQWLLTPTKINKASHFDACNLQRAKLSQTWPPKANDWRRKPQAENGSEWPLIFHASTLRVLGITPKPGESLDK